MRELAARCSAPPTASSAAGDERARLDLRTYQAVLRAARRARGLAASSAAGSRPRSSSARSSGRPFAPAPRARGTSPSSTSCAPERAGGDRVRARPRGGVAARRAPASAFLDDERRRELDGEARLAKADQVAPRPLSLLHRVHARLEAPVPRPRGGDRRRRARQPSPFWDDVQAVLDPADVARWTTRRALSALVWPIEGAPTDRERVRVARVARRTVTAPPRPLWPARKGWERRFDRALAAFDRPTRLTDPSVLEQLRGRGDVRRHGAGDVRGLLVDLVRRARARSQVDGRGDRRAHARLDRAPGAVQVLLRPPEALCIGARAGRPARRGARVPPRVPQRGDRRRGGVAARADRSPAQRAPAGAAGATWRRFVRAEAESELPLVPRRFEVSFGSERSAPELQRGLDLETFHLSGKIDRIDLDPLAARGIVWDYKSGKTAHSAAQIESEVKLQIPLYMLVLRDLVGVEPLGGLYQPLAGERKARGLLRSREGGRRPRLLAQRLRGRGGLLGAGRRAQDVAREIVGRMRAGDVHHDPRDGTCPSWCQLAPMCRVKRARWRRRSSVRPLPSRPPRSARPGSSSSPPGRGRGRRPCSSSASSARSEPASTSARSSSSPTPTALPAELRSRIRKRLAELGRPELTRELDGAWISTIHGFCTRLLRQYPFAAGLDPRFRVLDEAQAAVLLVEAFDEALTSSARVRSRSGWGCSRSTARRRCGGC